MEGNACLMRIVNEVVDTGGVERGRTALDAVHHISPGQQEFREVGAILPGCAGDECHLARRSRHHRHARPRAIHSALGIPRWAERRGGTGYKIQASAPGSEAMARVRPNCTEKSSARSGAMP